MKNKEIIQHINNLSALKSKDEKLPIEVSYAITKNLKTLTNEISPYEDEKKVLVEKYGDLNADDGTYKIKKEHVEEWAKEIDKLIEIDISLKVHMIKFESLSELSLSVNDVVALEFMIQE